MLRKWFRTYQFILAASAVFVWWLLRQPREDENEEIIEIVVPDLHQEAEAPNRDEKKYLKTTGKPQPLPTRSATPDDLTRIEGIGPKISGFLQASGINTYAALAACDAGELRQRLQDAGLRLARPDTWPEQATLAAGSRWEELEALQRQIKGGKKLQD